LAFCGAFYFSTAEKYNLLSPFLFLTAGVLAVVFGQPQSEEHAQAERVYLDANPKDQASYNLNKTIETIGSLGTVIFAALIVVLVNFFPQQDYNPVFLFMLVGGCGFSVILCLFAEAKLLLISRRARLRTGN